MGTFLAKLTGDNDRWYKLVDQIENEDYSGINLDNPVEYDPNNIIANQWFKIKDFNSKDCFLSILEQDFDVAELHTLTRNQFNEHKIDFIAFYNEHKYYIQKFTKGSFLKKKWFSLDGDGVKYFENDGLIYINPVPNCIYDNQSKCIYFLDIAKAYSIFKDLKLDYKEATDAETDRMLKSDLIKTKQGFNASGVGVSNRKRITSILAQYEAYEDNDKNTLKNYIREKVGNKLTYNANSDSFEISSDAELRLLLYGVQQRFYQPPLESEVQVATATTGLSNLLK